LAERRFPLAAHVVLACFDLTKLNLARPALALLIEFDLSHPSLAQKIDALLGPVISWDVLGRV
jgi:hypothetical protein